MIGQLLGEKGATVVTGGGGGIMSAVSSEAIKRDGITVGIFNDLNDIGIGDVYTVRITAGMKEGGPEFLLVQSSDIIIAIGGGAGTLSEIATAYRNQTPVVLLQGYKGFVDKLIPLLYDGKYLDERKRTPFYFTKTPEEAVFIAIKEGNKRLKKIVREGKKFYKEYQRLG